MSEFLGKKYDKCKTIFEGISGVVKKGEDKASFERFCRQDRRVIS